MKHPLPSGFPRGGTTNGPPPRKAKGMGVVLRVLLLLTMVAPALAVTPTISMAAPHATPMLLELAVQHPERTVPVIVQKSVADKSIEALVGKLGGTITRDLHIINAFSAELPARAVPQLAKAYGVRWISLDAPVSQSTLNPVFTTWADRIAGASNASIAANFNGTSIPASRYILFTAVGSATGLGNTPVKLIFDNSTIQFSAYGSNYKLSVPDAVLTFDPAASVSTTSYATGSSSFASTIKSSTSGNVLLASFAYKVPSSLPGGISGVTWSGRFMSDTPGVAVSWKWSAAVYSGLGNPRGNYNTLGLKPIDSSTGTQYQNSDPAGTPENYKWNVMSGGTGSGGYNFTGNYGTTQVVTSTVIFRDAASITDAGSGPSGNFGSANNGSTSFGGFTGEKMPGHIISKVEAALNLYVSSPLGTGEDPLLMVSLNGVSGSSVTLSHNTLNNYVGAGYAATIYVDLTSVCPVFTGHQGWQWSDFDGDLQLRISQSGFAASHYVYYDAVGLRVTTASGTDGSGGNAGQASANAPVDTSALGNVYNDVVRAASVWNEAPSFLQGSGVTVAVVDSGILRNKDVHGRVIANVNFNAAYHNAADGYGHGTFVSSVIGGSGTLSGGAYMGIAPQVNLVNVRVSDDQGMCYESDVVNGLQWINDNRSTYNIKVANISLNSANPESYNNSPLDAAAEILWFNGVVVVVSAGNSGGGSLYAPANDPFVITVGATDDKNTTGMGDDTVPSWSAYGVDETGHSKPDLVAPGTNIISTLPSNSHMTISVNHPTNRIDNNYFRMSGTSLSAPMVSAAAALLLQDEPGLNPDQVKYRLKATAMHDSAVWPGFDPAKAGAGYLDVYAAVHGGSTLNANTYLPASQLLWTGGQAVTWGSVNWNSVNWNSVNWNSVNWNSVNWNSVNWNSDYWSP